MTLLQIQNEHMSKILFNSLINEETLMTLQPVQGEFKAPHIYRQIKNVEMKLQIYAK